MTTLSRLPPVVANAANDVTSPRLLFGLRGVVRNQKLLSQFARMCGTADPAFALHLLRMLMFAVGRSIVESMGSDRIGPWCVPWGPKGTKRPAPGADILTDFADIERRMRSEYRGYFFVAVVMRFMCYGPVLRAVWDDIDDYRPRDSAGDLWKCVLCFLGRPGAEECPRPLPHGTRARGREPSGHQLHFKPSFFFSHVPTLSHPYKQLPKGRCHVRKSYRSFVSL